MLGARRRGFVWRSLRSATGALICKSVMCLHRSGDAPMLRSHVGASVHHSSSQRRSDKLPSCARNELRSQRALIAAALRNASRERLQATLDGTIGDAQAFCWGALRQYDRHGQPTRLASPRDRGLHHADLHYLLIGAQEAVVTRRARALLAPHRRAHPTRHRDVRPIRLASRQGRDRLVRVRDGDRGRHLVAARSPRRAAHAERGTRSPRSAI